MGAWIETCAAWSDQPFVGSLPSWERGLKQGNRINAYFWCKSLPSWERGLKLKKLVIWLVSVMSLHSWERGLKLVSLTLVRNLAKVAPLVGAWIETLFYTTTRTIEHSRSPRGSVD